MSQELKAFVVNMKSLYQDIDDPIVTGAGDANGRTFRVIFTQEAAAQLTPESKVYLSWFHQEQKIKGYNVFTKVNDDPETWEIHYPRAMLHEGNVLCCIEIVDSVSIAPSNNFMVHVLSDPNDGSTFVLSDDYTDFQHAVIELTCLSEQMRDQMIRQRIEFEDMQVTISTIESETHEALTKVETALEETKKIEQNVSERLDQQQQSVNSVVGTAEAAKEIADKAMETAQEALDKANSEGLATELWMNEFE